MISSLGEMMRKKLKQARDLIWCGPGDCAAFQRILCRYRSYGVPSKKGRDGTMPTLDPIDLLTGWERSCGL